MLVAAAMPAEANGALQNEPYRDTADSRKAARIPAFDEIALEQTTEILDYPSIPRSAVRGAAATEGMLLSVNLKPGKYLSLPAFVAR